jgi:antitoxin HicB
LTNLSKYPKQVFWSDEDEGFIAIAPDIPGCSAFGETEVTALAELDNAIEAWIDAARAAGNAIPTPSRPALRKEYSGKLLVRMPQSLHHELANAAKREEVSLNHFIVFVLSRYFSTANSVVSQSIGDTGVSNVVMDVTNVSNIHWFESDPTSVGFRTVSIGPGATSFTTGPGSMTLVGANLLTTPTATPGVGITSGTLRSSEEYQSRHDNLGKRFTFYGKVNYEVARNMVRLNTFSARSGSE